MSGGSGLIIKSFVEGFSTALRTCEKPLFESDHWLAGWDGGCAFREQMKRRVNEYLRSLKKESEVK
jgi:hypothetical protein